MIFSFVDNRKNINGFETLTFKGEGILTPCPYEPDKCHAMRGLGPWQEVDCDTGRFLSDPLDVELELLLNRNIWSANKDVCKYPQSWPWGRQ